MNYRRLNHVRLEVRSTQKYLSIPLTGYLHITLRDGELRCIVSSKHPLTSKRYDIEIPIRETEAASLLRGFSRFNALADLRLRFHKFLLKRSLMSSTHYYHLNKLKELKASDLIKVPDSLLKRAIEEYDKRVAGWEVEYKLIKRREEEEESQFQQERERWCRDFVKRQGLSCTTDVVRCAEDYLQRRAHEMFSRDRDYVSTEVEWVGGSYDIKVKFGAMYEGTYTSFLTVEAVCEQKA